MFGFSRSLKMKTLNFIKRKCKQRRGELAEPSQAPMRLLVERFVAPHRRHDRTFALFRIRVRWSPRMCDVTHRLMVAALVSATHTCPHI